MIGIALSPRAALEKKVEELKIPWPQIEGRSSANLPRLYGVYSVSTFILVDREGKILARGSRLDRMELLVEDVLKGATMLNRPAAARH